MKGGTAVSKSVSVSGKNKEGKREKGAFAVLKRLIPFIAQYKGSLILCILFSAAGVILQLYVPILFGEAIDRIIGAGAVDFYGLSVCLLKVVVVACVSAVCVWGMNLFGNRISYNTVKSLRSRAIRHLQRLPVSFFDKNSAGDTVSRIIADTDVVCDGLLLGFTQLFSGVVTIIVTLVFMFIKSPVITGMIVLLTPLSFIVARFISKKTFGLFKKQSRTRGEQLALIDEIINGQKTVKANGYEKRATERFKGINDRLVNDSCRAIFSSSLTNPSTRFINSVIYAGVALIGINLIRSGSLTVGGLSVMLAYANQYMKPFNDISSVITELQNALVCADRMFELMQEEPMQEETDNRLFCTKGKVEIENLYFSYDKSRPLIEDFSLSVSPGTRVAVVGPTGCGKTTLINLLMRFYDADSGSISVDSVPIDSVTRRSLRKNFGMVLQDTWIMNSTVRENIRFGRPEAQDDEIIKAAEAAHCMGFIKQLPDGLDTVLNENTLSQGQRQLLCIARVMLCRPPMLILDEATSNIDTRTEVLIQRAFDELMCGRTSFVVAHRLSTVVDASVIIVMRSGHIVESGTHEQLMKKGGFYSELYNSQFLPPA